jgi:hypothetical protein
LNEKDTRTVVAVSAASITVDRPLRFALAIGNAIAAKSPMFLGAEAESARTYTNQKGLQIISESHSDESATSAEKALKLRLDSAGTPIAATTLGGSWSITQGGTSLTSANFPQSPALTTMVVESQYILIAGELHTIAVGGITQDASPATTATITIDSNFKGSSCSGVTVYTDGFGTGIEFQLQTAGSTVGEAGGVDVVVLDASEANFRTEIGISTAFAGAVARRMAVSDTKVQLLGSTQVRQTLPLDIYVAPTHALTHSISLTHSRTQSLTHSRTQSLTHSITHALTHSITHALTHSITHALTREHPTHASTCLLCLQEISTDFGDLSIKPALGLNLLAGTDLGNYNGGQVDIQGGAANMGATLGTNLRELRGTEQSRKKTENMYGRGRHTLPYISC